MDVLRTNLEVPATRKRHQRLLEHAKGQSAKQMATDIFLLLEELDKIEHLQDRDLIDNLQMRYGWRR
jgi:hypothetical protein